MKLSDALEYAMQVIQHERESCEPESDAAREYRQVEDALLILFNAEYERETTIARLAEESL